MRNTDGRDGPLVLGRPRRYMPWVRPMALIASGIAVGGAVLLVGMWIGSHVGLTVR